MNSVAIAFDKFRAGLYGWRVSQHWAIKLLMAFGFAIVIALASKAQILTPFSPVVFSLSTFAVLLTAVFMGKRWGAVSIAIYAGMALLGLPVMTTALGITFGYVVGYFIAALAIGHIVDSSVGSRKLFPMLAMMSFASVAILLCGALGMYIYSAGAMSLSTAFTLGFVPFIVSDLIKSVAVACLAVFILTKK